MNMKTNEKKGEFSVDLCIIGAGAAGLSIAAGAAQLGRSVVLYEAGEMGGDCLNHGCVPSKALIAAGKAAKGTMGRAELGISGAKAKVDWDGVKTHIKGVIETIAPVDSQERFEGFGCIVIRERAKFLDDKTVISAHTKTRAKRIIIATGSRASVPPIFGLDKIDYLTNETIFDVDVLPKHLIIIGAGPIGLELGQAFARFGSKVDIFDIAPPLSRNEPEHAGVLVESLKAEGVGFYAPVGIKSVEKKGSHIVVNLEDGSTIKGSHLLVAVGRRAVISDLDLGRAAVKTDRSGIVTNEQLQTSNKRVYAVGDVSERGGLTHAAGYQAGIIIKNFYFVPFFKSGVSTKFMPACIYTGPELAAVGLSEQTARATYSDVRMVQWNLDENDRAIAERQTDGGVKIMARKNGLILGASIVGENAGEIIQIIGLAMSAKMKIIDLTKMIAPYPTRAEIIKRAASSWYTDAVFGPSAKRLAKWMTRFH